MSKILEQLSEKGLDVSISVIEKLNKVANMETVDFNATLGRIEDIANKVIDNEYILDMKLNAMKFQQTIIKDNEFVEMLGKGAETLDIMGKIQTTLDIGKEAVDMVSDVSGMVSIIRDENLTEQEKVAQLEADFLVLKENGADLAIAVLDSTFGNIPFVGSKIVDSVEDELRNFITSESGLENVSNKIGAFFDRGIENFADKINLEERLDKSGFTDWLKRKLQPEEEEQENTFETSISTDDVDVTNIAGELEANLDLLYSNMNNFVEQIKGI